MRDTVVVFARAPRLGTIKRRLARDVGHRTALGFHRNTLIALLRGLCTDRRFHTVLAVTPDRAVFPLPVAAARIGQGGGDIGHRMHRACARFRRGRVVIIGCDVPAAAASDVAAAFKALGMADAVFGPATDGGYWLVGLGPRRPSSPFAGARWSTEHALADTLRNFRCHRTALLRRLSDVDTVEDWLRYKSRKEAKGTASRSATTGQPLQ
jgi:rSAM/selenodomain-associated transferase 1